MDFIHLINWLTDGNQFVTTSQDVLDFQLKLEIEVTFGHVSHRVTKRVYPFDKRVAISFFQSNLNLMRGR